MEPPISPVLFSVFLFLGMLIMLEVGRRLAVRRRSKEVDGERSNLGPVEGAVFALFGLLMAFTFSGAASRFNEKRMLIAEEANTIETAYLRLHLVPAAEPKLQELFRRYLDSRLETYRKLPNMKAASLEMGNSKKIQEQIWTEATSPPPVRWRCKCIPRGSSMHFFLDWVLSARSWRAIGWRPDSTGVGCTFSASR